MSTKALRKMKLAHILHSPLAFMLLTLMLKVTYDLSYVYLVSPYFSWTPAYYPLLANNIKIAESYILALIIGLTLPHQARQPSDFMLVFLGSVVILPMLTLYGLADRDRVYTYMTLFTYFLILITVKLLPKVKIGVFRSGFRLVMIGSVVFATTVVFLLIWEVGLEFFTIRFWEYSIMVQHRFALEDQLKKNPFLAYSYFWLFIAIIPTLMLGSLVRRHYTAFVVFLLVQILLTGLTARRHTLAIIPVLLGTYVIAEKRRLAPVLMVVGCAAIVAIATVLSLSIPNLRIMGTLMERFFFVPPRANYAYYEFFSYAGYVYLSSTKLPSPIRYPFEMVPERMVGYYVLLNPTTVSSGGFLATSYMHFGFLGMVIFGVLVSSLMRLADSLTLGRMPLRVGVPLSMVIFDGLLRGADLTTWLITFGGLVGIIILLLLGLPAQRYTS
jgi:hypothetical protein